MTITTRQLVEREVYYNVSTLVHELAGYMEELLPVCVSDDWETPARDVGGIETESGFKLQDGSTVYATWQELCEAINLEPFQNEAYEHWLVSNWLADKLEAKGEMVLRDFLGLTIWGRCTTGQMIEMDAVIEEIHADLTKAANP